MKLYTSSFSNKGTNVRGISIARGVPGWFIGLSYHPLNPTISLLEEYKRNQISWEDYQYVYQRDVLRELDPWRVAYILGDEAILLCWETSGFCHRHLVADWMRNAGIDIEEL